MIRSACSLAILVCMACAGRPGPALEAVRYEGDLLVPVSEIDGDFLWRQRVSIRYRGKDARFEAIVQKHCSELTLLGLTPLERVAFSIVQRDHAIVKAGRPSGGWPLAPERILSGLHRAYFVPVADPPAADSVVEWVYRGRLVRDRWRSTRLVERVFEPPAGVGASGVVVEYAGGLRATEGPPFRVRLEDERLGYVIEIETYSSTRLTCETGVQRGKGT